MNMCQWWTLEVIKFCDIGILPQLLTLGAVFIFFDKQWSDFAAVLFHSFFHSYTTRLDDAITVKAI